MKNTLWLLLLLSAITTSNACDVCGGGQDNLIGFLPNPTKHLVGLRYNYNNYAVIHPAMSEFFQSETSYQHFHSTKLIARVRLWKQFTISGSIPYYYRSWEENQIKNQLNGIGDAQLMANYSHIAYLDSTKLNRVMVTLGAGAKLPTGNWTQLDEDGQLISRGFQLGSGSYDFVANASILFKFKSWGVSNESFCQITTANSHGYKYGNSFQSQLLTFKTIDFKESRIIPQLGGVYFMNQKDDKNTRYNWIVKESGGSYLGTVMGIDVVYKATLIGLNYVLPISHYLSDGLVENTQKINLKMTYLF